MSEALATAIKKRHMTLIAKTDDANATDRVVADPAIVATPSSGVSSSELKAQFAEFEKGLETLRRINIEMQHRLSGRT